MDYIEKLLRELKEDDFWEDFVDEELNEILDFVSDDIDDIWDI